MNTIEAIRLLSQRSYQNNKCRVGSGRKGRGIMIIIPDKLRRPAEVEREELRKQLSEARAENAKLRKLLATRIEATRLDEAVDQLADARAEIERLDHHRRAGWTEIKRKDALIEQMRTALQAVQRDDLNGLSLRGKDKVDAALSAANRFAAERGE